MDLVADGPMNKTVCRLIASDVSFWLHLSRLHFNPFYRRELNGSGRGCAIKSPIVGSGSDKYKASRPYLCLLPAGYTQIGRTTVHTSLGSTALSIMCIVKAVDQLKRRKNMPYSFP